MAQVLLLSLCEPYGDCTVVLPKTNDFFNESLPDLAREKKMSLDNITVTYVCNPSGLPVAPVAPPRRQVQPSHVEEPVRTPAPT